MTRKRGEKRMTKFQAVRSITGVKEFSGIMYALAEKAGCAEALVEELMKEIPETGLQTLHSVARHGTYPLSLDGLQ